MPLPSITYKMVVAFLCGIFFTLLVNNVAGQEIRSALYDLFHVHDDSHSHTDSNDAHVHADFLMYINDERVRFIEEKYQATARNLPHPSLHVHDGIDHVLHRHAEDVTFVDFINSLGYTLTEECITTDQNEAYCSDDENKLLLYVNKEIMSTFADYVFQDEDQILLYYGNPKSEHILIYLSEITDESCIYTGTCPERGTAPPESCGITCEL